MWIHRHLEQAQMRVVQSKNFSILHSEESIMRQVRVAQSKLELMNPSARAGMQAYLNDLRYCNHRIGLLYVCVV